MTKLAQGKLDEQQLKMIKIVILDQNMMTNGVASTNNDEKYFECVSASK